MIAFYIGLTIIVLMACGGIWAWRSDIKNWNDGKCTCGTLWRRFDTDSQGGRGYTCDDCGCGMWISYPRVDKNYDIGRS